MNLLKFSRLPFLMMIALVSIGTFVGCSDDPEAPDGTDVSVPKEGSTYTYTEYDLDDQGNKIDTTEVEVVATVEQTGLSVAGKTDVLEFSDEYEDGTIDTGYVAYESNGDMSMLLSFDDVEDIDPIWVTIPFGSKTAKSYAINETIPDGLGGMDSINLTINTKYLREETATIQGETMDVWVGEMEVTGSLPGIFGGTIEVNVTSEVYFVPEIGYVYKTDATESGFGTGSRTIRMLVSYSLAS